MTDENDHLKMSNSGKGPTKSSRREFLEYAATAVGAATLAGAAALGVKETYDGIKENAQAYRALNELIRKATYASAKEVEAHLRKNPSATRDINVTIGTGDLSSLGLIPEETALAGLSKESARLTALDAAVLLQSDALTARDVAGVLIENGAVPTKQTLSIIDKRLDRETREEPTPASTHVQKELLKDLHRLLYAASNDATKGWIGR